MTPDAKLKLRNLLIKHEEYRKFPYTDSTNHLTVGIGRNLSDRGISLNEALQLLDDDLLYFTDKLNHYVPGFVTLSDNRKIVLVDMCFNVGVNGLLLFKEMLKALAKQDYDSAADEILNSKAAQQCGERYHELANIMRSGEL